LLSSDLDRTLGEIHAGGFVLGANEAVLLGPEQAA
jgi:hypothetical protein